ncbi:hypothetical protein KR018_000759 [Drosophila ironensis]|nr:hypothetical protein KR018_000759 [Drosophila ironensis]
MEASFVSLIFVGICCLAFISQSEAECCKDSKIVYFTGDPDCEKFGGRYDPDGCRTNICADGKPRKGTYCGRGPCNIFGCNCDGGCITGDWVDSFKEHYKRYDIRVFREQNYEQDSGITM